MKTASAKILNRLIPLLLSVSLIVNGFLFFQNKKLQQELTIIQTRIEIDTPTSFIDTYITLSDNNVSITYDTGYRDSLVVVNTEVVIKDAELTSVVESHLTTVHSKDGCLSLQTSFTAAPGSNVNELYDTLLRSPDSFYLTITFEYDIEISITIYVLKEESSAN